MSELGKVQEKLGTGYLSAFPTEFFDRVEALKPVWAPYYTVRGPRRGSEAGQSGAARQAKG